MTHTPEFKRPPGVLCDFCNEGSGCNIYTVRPKSCVDFECMWLNADWPVELRPDKCGMLFEDIKNHPTVIALVDSKICSSWKEQPIYNILLNLLREDRGILILNGTQKDLLIPEGRTHEQVWYDIMRISKESGK
jgi:hypothetical protein